MTALPFLGGDRSDFRAVNDFAQETPWLHGVMSFMARDGIVLVAVALLAAWWIARRERSPRKVAVAVWGLLAALIGLAFVQPISGAAAEQRPFVGHPGVLRLIPHNADAGFPSDHATVAGAVAVALFFVGWQLGLLASVLATTIAFSRVYVGVHYPQDVLAGLALGGVVAGLGIYLVVPLLSRVMTALTGTPLRPLLVAGDRSAASRKQSL